MKLIDKIKKNKLLYFLGVLIVGIFIVLIVRFTYAYLAANVNEARGDVSVDSDETDNLKFAVGDPLSIDATPTTLPENGENLVDTTTATATLLANSTNNTAEYPYWVYFTISNNTFVYSDGSTPEIILTVTDPEGNPVTNIDGLTYGTFNGVAGFDVTTQNGTFAVADGYTITSTSSTEETVQTWNFTLTYLNLSIDQSINFGNSMTTEIKMQKEKSKVVFADYITSQVYTGVDGENDLYYHDGVGTYTNADQEAGDNSYRYSGANPNNYVCFGSDEETCPDDNLYRIIGVFDGQVKLIKATGIGYYEWSSDENNKWDETTKPDIYYILNTDYYKSLLSEWQGLIDQSHIWQVGGINSSNGTDISKTVYDYEVGANQTGYIETMAIGLMYVSDYGFGTNPENWLTSLKAYSNIIDNNWLYSGEAEWTISLESLSDKGVFIILKGDCLSNDSDLIGNLGSLIGMTKLNVRPAFYLNSNVSLENGSGTASDPYRIA